MDGKNKNNLGHLTAYLRLCKNIAGYAVSFFIRSIK